MIRRERIYRKWLAGLLAAAFVTTSAPLAAFADEIPEEAVAVEEAEAAGEVTDEAENITEDVSGEVTDDAVYAENTVSAQGYKYQDAIPAELEKETTAVLFPGKENPEGKYDKYRYFVYEIKESGFYQFTAKTNVPMEYRIAVADDKFPTTQPHNYLRASTNAGDDAYYADKTDYIRAGRYYLEIYTGHDEVESAETTFTLSFKEAVYGTDKDNPTEIHIGESISHKLNDIFPNDDDNNSYLTHYFTLNLDTAGVATLYFTDDSQKPETDHCTVQIDHADNSYLGTYSINHSAHKYEEFAGTDYRWLDKDTIKLSMPQGKYNIKVYGEDKLTYSLSFKEFQPLTAGKNETVLQDKKLGGSNDHYDPLDTDVGEYYSAEKNGPMPEIQLGQKYKGILTRDSRVDYYQFKLAKDGPLFITADSDDIGSLEFDLIRLDPKLNVYLEATTKPATAEAAPNAQLKKQQFEISLDKDGSWKFYKNFPAGDYVIYIHSNRGESSDQTLNKYGSKGIYSFILSSGKTDVKSKPVTKLTLDKTVLSLTPEADGILKATVAPADADNTGMRFDVTEGNDVISISLVSLSGNEAKPNVTAYSVKALKKGSAVIKVTTDGANKKGQPLTAECKVSVFDGKVAPDVATKQKVNLHSAEYFGGAYDKKDKWEVQPKANGSVSKGIFTAKKPGVVTVIRKRKEGKVLIPLEAVTFTIETPKYIQKDKKKKDIKTFTLKKKYDHITPDQVISIVSSNLVQPSGYGITDKKGSFVFDEATGLVSAKKSGSCTVTVYYGDIEKKLAAKYTYTVKAQLPTIKENVSIKSTAKKPTTVKLTKVSENAVREWRLEGVSQNAAGDDIPDGVQVSANCISIEPVTTAKPKTNLMSCKVKPEAAAAAGNKAFLIVKVDGVDYWCKVTIK